MPASSKSRLQAALLGTVLFFIVIGALLPVEVRRLVVAPFPRSLHADVIGHAVAFGALAFLLANVLSVRPRRVLAVSLAVAISTEVLQFFVPGRTPLISDVATDLIG